MTTRAGAISFRRQKETPQAQGFVAGFRRTHSVFSDEDYHLLLEFGLITLRQILLVELKGMRATQLKHFQASQSLAKQRVRVGLQLSVSTPSLWDFGTSGSWEGVVCTSRRIGYGSRYRCRSQFVVAVRFQDLDT